MAKLRVTTIVDKCTNKAEVVCVEEVCEKPAEAAAGGECGSEKKECTEEPAAAGATT